MIEEEYKGFLIHISRNDAETIWEETYSVFVIDPKSNEELVDLGNWGSENQALEVAQNWIDEN